MSLDTTSTSLRRHTNYTPAMHRHHSDDTPTIHRLCIDTTSTPQAASTPLQHHSDYTPAIHRLYIDITPTTFVWYGFQLHRVRLLGLHSDYVVCEAIDYNPMVSGAKQHSRLRFVENSRLCRRCAFYIPFPRVSLSLNPRLLNRCRSPVLRTQSPPNVLRHYIDTTGCIDITPTSLQLYTGYASTSLRHHLYTGYASTLHQHHRLHRHYIDTTSTPQVASTSLRHHSDITGCIDITPTTFVWYGFLRHRVRLLGLHSDCIGATATDYNPMVSGAKHRRAIAIQ